jgi:hypothetical protein
VIVRPRGRPLADTALIASSVFEPVTPAPLVFRSGRLLEMLAIMVLDIGPVSWTDSTSPGWHDQLVTWRHSLG